MTKDKKVVVIQEIKDLLQDAKVVYVANMEGLNAAQTSDFRRQAFKSNIKLKVVKNTMLIKAMEQIDTVDYSPMFETFKGNSVLMVGEVANAPAKLIQGFRKKADIPSLKAAYLEESIYIGDDKLASLADLKSKEEMIGEIIGLLQSPIQRLVSALQNRSENEEAVKETPVAEAAVETPEAPVETPTEEKTEGTEDAPAAE